MSEHSRQPETLPARQADNAATSSVSPSNPFKGPGPFKPKDRLYGREQEIRTLLRLLIAERSVLFYSPSGAGKTSLLQAGLIPMLKEEGYRVLPIIRVVHAVTPSQASLLTENPENRYVFSTLLSLEEGLVKEGLPVQEQTPLDLLAHLTLAQYLQSRPTVGAESEKEVLIFDQFEEIFTADPTDLKAKAEFFRQLGLALKGRWALCSLRKEYLAELDEYLWMLPNHFSARYRLGFLDSDRAREAIERPAEQAGVTFQAGQGRAKGAAEKLVDNLALVRVPQPTGPPIEQPGPFVEPVYLQVVCFNLWESFKKQKPEATEITAEDIENSGGVNNALIVYYNDQVALAAKDTGVRERAIRDWLENALIEEGVRRPVLVGLEREYGLTPAVIECLEKAYLVRRETERSARLELTHDRLIEPIQNSNKVWRENNLSLLQLQTAVWVRKNRPDGLWLRDQDLKEAREWADTHKDEITPDETAFLEGSEKEYARALQEHERVLQEKKRAAEQLAREAAHKTILARLTSVLIVCLLVVVWLAFVANRNANRAVMLAKRAEALKLAANANTLMDKETSLPLLLSQEATRLNPGPETYQNLLDCLGRRPYLGAYLRGHARWVWHVTFSPDNRTLVSASLDYTIRLWDIPSGQALGPPLKKHTNCVNYVAFNPNQSAAMFASASDDHHIIVWSLRNRLQPQSLYTLAWTKDEPKTETDRHKWDGQVVSGHSDEVYCVAFSHDGYTMASCGRDNRVLLWDVRSATPLRTSMNTYGSMHHPGEVYRVVFSPDGALMATSCGDHRVRLWDVRNPQHPQYLAQTPSDPTSSDPVLSGHTQNVYGLAFSPDGKILASGSQDKTVRIWNVHDPRHIVEIGQPLTTHTDTVWDVAFKDDNLLASCSRDRTIQLWDISDRAHPSPLRGPLWGHDSDVYSVTFSSNGSYMASSSGDTTVILWDLAHRLPLAANSEIKSVTYSPALDLLAIGSRNVSLWTTDRKQGAAYRMQVAAFGDQHGFVASLRFSHDGTKLACGYEDHTVLLWNITRSGGEVRFTKSPVSFLGHLKEIYDLTFSPNGRWLVASSRDRSILVWEVATGRLAKQCGDPRSTNDTYPDGKYLYNTDGVFRLAFSSDGNKLAWGSRDNTIVIWDSSPPNPRDWHIVRQYRSTDEILCVAFSPNSEILASSAKDGTVTLWDANTENKRIAALPGRTTGAVYCMAFSPDGNQLILGDDENVTALWNISDPGNSRLLTILNTGHTGRITDLCFLQSGKIVASASTDKTLSLSDVDWELQRAESWQTLVCQMVRRNLTHKEWNTYVAPDTSLDSAGVDVKELKEPYHVTCPDYPVPAD